MSPITVGVLLFSLLGAVDYVIGSKLGIGKEFEKAFSLFGPLALSMLGMIVGKLISGVCAVILALILYKDKTPAPEATA